jgi:hypothetical protein
MATVRTPAGTRIYMESATGASQAVSAVTKASPAVLTYAGVDPANGNYMALTSFYGMTEFEDALVKVSAVDTVANTFAAEDQDSTGYGTFTAGNMTPVTLGTEIQVATGFSISGGEQQFAEYTFLWDSISRKFPTIASGVQFDLDCIWDPNDTGMIAVRQAADTKAKKAFKVVFADGLEMLFYGYIGAPGLPQASDINSVMKTKATIVLATKPRYVTP